MSAGLWGFARTARLEESGMQLRCLDLDAAHEANAAEILQAWLPRLSQTKNEEVEIALRPNAESATVEVFVPRLQRSKTTVENPMFLQMSARGSLANLRPIPQEQRDIPGMGEVELRIRAIGLNFRDVLNVMGLYPGDPGYPGGDCSGTVVSIGEGVPKLRVGDDVFGIAGGCVRTYRCTNQLLVDYKPESWSFEQAAAWPVTFTTTDEAFTDMAKLKKGDRVLIHAATGGVGIVAVQYAQRVGAVVYATAGKDEKQQFLRDMESSTSRPPGTARSSKRTWRSFVSRTASRALTWFSTVSATTSTFRGR
jgi:hypothetical protein